MKIISQKQIRELNISPAKCVEWGSKEIDIIRETEKFWI